MSFSKKVGLKVKKKVIKGQNRWKKIKKYPTVVRKTYLIVQTCTVQLSLATFSMKSITWHFLCFSNNCRFQCTNFPICVIRESDTPDFKIALLGTLSLIFRSFKWWNDIIGTQRINLLFSSVSRVFARSALDFSGFSGVKRFFEKKSQLYFYF